MEGSYPPSKALPGPTWAEESSECTLQETMTEIADIVQISIDRATATPSRPSLSTPTIVGPSQVFPNRIRTYTKLTDMTTDGFGTDSPEYIAAAVMKAQNPSLRKWKVGRVATVPAESVTLQVLAQGTALGEKYEFTVDGSTIAYTVSSTVTSYAVASTLAGLIDALAPVAATSSADTITITRATADGKRTRIRNWQRRLLKYKNNTSWTATTLQADLNSILTEDSDFGALYFAENAASAAAAVAAWAETNEKLFAYTSNDDQNVSSTVTNDVFSTLKLSSYTQSYGIQNANDTQGHSGAAWDGLILAKFKPGQENWNFKTLAGIQVDDLNGTETSALDNKHANYFVTVGGLNLTQGNGKVASGEYIDVIRFLNWLKSEMGLRVFAALANLPKVPFTDTGLDVIRSVMLAVLQDGIDVGGLVDGTQVVEMPVVADIDPITKGERTLDNVTFSAELQGAINKVIVQGTINL